MNSNKKTPLSQEEERRRVVMQQRYQETELQEKLKRNRETKILTFISAAMSIISLLISLWRE